MTSRAENRVSRAAYESMGGRSAARAISSMTKAQGDAYVDNNCVDIAGARVVCKELMKLIILLARDLQK